MPDLPDQFGPGEHGGRVRGEEGQQLELLEGEQDLTSVDPDAALRVVQAQPVSLAVAGLVAGLVGAWPGAGRGLARPGWRRTW